MKNLARSLALLFALTAFFVPNTGFAQGVTPPSFDPQLPTWMRPAPGCQTFTIAKGWDTWLNAEAPTRTYGSDPKLVTDGTPQATALVRWDLSTIPAGTRFTRAAMLVYHIDRSDESQTIFQLYALRRNWSDIQANWQSAAANVRWATPGAADPIRDRESEPMGETPLTRRSPAAVLIEFNEEGLAQVQRWIDGVEPNYGLVIQDYNSGDAFRFGSFESQFPPRLLLSTCQHALRPTPTPVVSGTPSTSLTSQPTALAVGTAASLATPTAVLPLASPAPLASPTAVLPLASPTAALPATALPQAAATPGADRTATPSLSLQDGVAPDALYAGTQDTYVNQASPGVNYGASRIAWLSGAGPSRTGVVASALIRWDVSPIPARSQVVSATITLNTVVAFAGVYNVYEAKRPWDERVLTWVAGRGNSWLNAGAAGWSEASAVSLGQYLPARPGPVVIPLTQQGLVVIQRWIDNPAQNYGVVISNSAAGTLASFETSEALTAANRPKLTITYR